MRNLLWFISAILQLLPIAMIVFGIPLAQERDKAVEVTMAIATVAIFVATFARSIEGMMARYPRWPSGGGQQ